MSIMPLSRPAVSSHHEVVTTTGLRRFLARDTAFADHHRGAPATLVVLDPHGRQLRLRRNRRWSRALARLLAAGLDRQLASGRSPESSRFLAARAHVLVSPAMRRELAADLANVIAQAGRPAVMRNPRVPINRSSILACEPEIRETITALLTQSPAPARGAAMVNRLLSDGSGPLYNRRRAEQLSIALAEARAVLDPTGSALFPA
jgi:hypothetical protein